MKKIIKSIVLFSFVVIVTLFSSCENCLTSEELLTQLNENLLYANADYVTVNIQAQKDSYSSIFPLPTVYTNTYKKSDRIQLEFEPTSDYVFYEWEATPENIVSFANPESNNTIAVIQEFTPEQIIITPVCKQLPKIISSFPSVNDGYKSVNTEVRVDFNIDMSGFDFSIGSNASIHIFDELNTDLSSYFYEPKLSENGLTLTFLTKADALKNYIDSLEKEKITVHFEFTEKVVNEETKQYLQTNSNSSFNILYNNEIEKSSPVFEKFDVKRSSNSESSIVIKEFTSFETKGSRPEEHDYYKNHVGKNIYLDTTFYDYESGIKEIKIYELKTHELISDVNKSKKVINYLGNAKFTEEGIDFDYKTVIKVDALVEKNKKYTFNQTYSLHLDEDCVVKIIVVAVDNCGNESKKSFSVLLDNAKNYDYSILNNVYFDDTECVYAIHNDAYTKAKFIKDFNDNIRTISIPSDCLKYTFLSRNEIDYTNEISSVKYVYTNDYGQTISGEIPKTKKTFSSNTHGLTADSISWAEQYFTNPDYYSFTIPENQVKNISGFSFKLIFKADEIFEKEVTVSYPKQGEIQSISTDMFIFPKIEKNCSQACLILNNDYCIATGFDKKINDIQVSNEYNFEVCGKKVIVLDKPDYYVANINKQSNVFIFGPVNNSPISYENAESSQAYTGEPPALTSFTLLPIQNSNGYLMLKAQIEPSWWDTFDNLYIQAEYKNKKENFYFSKDESLLEKRIEIIDDMLNNSFSYTLCGVKNGSILKGTPETYPKISESSYTGFDTFSPKAYDTVKNFDGHYFLFGLGDKYPVQDTQNRKIYDIVSGIDLSNTKYLLNHKDISSKVFQDTNYPASNTTDYSEFIYDGVGVEYVMKIPLYDFGNVGDGLYSFTALVYDKSSIHNYVQVDTNINIKTIAGFEVSDGKITTSKNQSTFIAKWNNKWETQETIKADKEYNLKSAAENTFVKFWNTSQTQEAGIITISKSNDQYFYTGTGSTINKFFNNDEGLLITSDQPVFVHTLIANTEYSICKNWKYDEWNLRHESVCEEVLKFTPANTAAQIYNFDMNKIPDNCCYVAVIHFANGQEKLGKVYQN